MGEPPTARGLDTNVLLRYLLADDDAQHDAATRLIEETLSADAPGLVHPVALCETVWALRQVYKVPKLEVVRVLNLVLDAPTIRVLEEERVREAVALYAGSPADFADAFLAVAYLEAGTGLRTFDHAAGALPGAARLS